MENEKKITLLPLWNYSKVLKCCINGSEVQGQLSLEALCPCIFYKEDQVLIIYTLDLDHNFQH